MTCPDVAVPSQSFYLYCKTLHSKCRHKTSPELGLIGSCRSDSVSPSHHTYLAFFLEDGFTRLLPSGLWAGRSLKRLSLVCGNGMLDLSLVTTTSSLPPMSTVLKGNPEITVPGKPRALSGLSSTPCECDAKCVPGSCLCVRWQGGTWRVCWGSGLCAVFLSWSWNAGGSDDSLNINT